MWVLALEWFMMQMALSEFCLGNSKHAVCGTLTFSGAVFYFLQLVSPWNLKSKQHRVHAPFLWLWSVSCRPALSPLISSTLLWAAQAYRYAFVMFLVWTCKPWSSLLRGRDWLFFLVGWVGPFDPITGALRWGLATMRLQAKVSTGPTQ